MKHRPLAYLMVVLLVGAAGCGSCGGTSQPTEGTAATTADSPMKMTAKSGSEGGVKTFNLNKRPPPGLVLDVDSSAP